MLRQETLISLCSFQLSFESGHLIDQRDHFFNDILNYAGRFGVIFDYSLSDLFNFLIKFSTLHFNSFTF